MTAGAYNLGGAGAPLKPEKVNAYEAGIKTTEANGRLRANIAGFYYDYSDLQVGKVQGPLLVLENAASARIYGLEGEFVAKPVDNLTLSVNASWLHARFTRYVTADQARPAGYGVTKDEFGQPAFNLSGKALPQSPNYTVNLAAEYRIPVAKGSLTEAYLIEDGRITAPIKGATLIGLGHEALMHVSMVGADLRLDNGMCGKNGQTVPVCIGQPTVRIDEMVVGGTAVMGSDTNGPKCLTRNSGAEKVE